MKTFQQFILEANKHPIPADEYTKWQNDRDEGKGPASKTFDGVEYQMRGKGTDKKTGKKRWAVSPTSARKASAAKRNKAEQETALSQDELRNAAGGDTERSALAKDTEETGIKKVKKRGKRIEKATGVKQSLGHKQPLQPDDPNPEDPGHSLSNIQPEPLSPNTSKKNRRPESGESGYGLTRTQATQDAVRRGDKLGSKIDREISLIRSGKGSRAARLLSYLRRDKTSRPDTGAARRMNVAGKARGLPEYG
jgi:hypothetical protein